MNDRDVAAIAVYELAQARGYDADTLATKRQLALDYYNGLLPAPPTTTDPATGATVKIRSGVVSCDVADSIHALMAQCGPIIKTTLIEFEPENAQDEPSAQAESDFVRKVLERQGGFRAFFSSTHDAFLTGTGWLKVTREDFPKETVYTYATAEVSPEALAAISQPADGEKVEVENDGETVQVIVTTQESQLVFRSVPVEKMFFSNDLGLDGGLPALRFVAELHPLTVSQLIEKGYPADKVKALPDFSASSAVSAREGSAQKDSAGDAAQDANKLKEVYECYLQLDKADNGKAELYRLVIGGNEVLEQAPATHAPYIAGSAVPVPHRVEGLGVFELLQNVQDAKTHILRQYLDNLEVANLGRVGAVEGQVNMGDLLNGRVSGVVRMRSPDAVFPLPAVNIAASALPGLEYMDQVRSQRVGASLDFNEMQAQLMSSSATAAAGQLAKVEQLAGWFCSNLVETLLKPAFIMAHKLLREESTGPIQMKQRGQWIETDPAQWPERKNLTVNMGMTSSERAARVNALGAVVQQQQQLLSMGGADILVGLPNLYNSLADWTRANDLGCPDSYWIDPTSQQAQQAGQVKAQQEQQAAQQQTQMQLELQRLLMKMQQDFELEKQNRDLQFKYFDARLDAEIKEAEMTSSGVIEGAKLRQQAVNNALNRRSQSGNAQDTPGGIE